MKAPFCFGAESLFPKQQSWCIFGSSRLPTKQQRKSWHGSWSWWIKWGNGISFDPPQRKIQFGLTSIMNVLCFLLYFDGCFCCCLASKLTVMCSSSGACKVIYTKYSKRWLLWYTPLNVCAENVKSWFKSWVFPFTFQAYILSHTLNCMCVSLFKFHIWILEQF